MSNKSYVLITPARNEEGYIEIAIRSIISQTIRPKKWVIVSDGSADHTNDILDRYASNHDFIDFVSIKGHAEWNFASKVDAIRAGCDRLKGIDYEFLGNLDADIGLEPEYYERVLLKFEENNKLGIAGGMILELVNGKFKVLKYNLKSVAGAVQLFRRQCYEEIGGYTPSANGGIDAIAEVMSRMHGWEVQSFPEIKAYHHRQIGENQRGVLISRFRYGIRDYSIGTDPLFMFLKSIDRFRETPFFIGGMLMMLGFLWSAAKREPRPVSNQFVKCVRKEQRNRIFSFLQRSATS